MTLMCSSWLYIQKNAYGFSFMTRIPSVPPEDYLPKAFFFKPKAYIRAMDKSSRYLNFLPHGRY